MTVLCKLSFHITLPLILAWVLKGIVEGGGLEHPHPLATPLHHNAKRSSSWEEEHDPPRHLMAQSWLDRCPPHLCTSSSNQPTSHLWPPPATISNSICLILPPSTAEKRTNLAEFVMCEREWWVMRGACFCVCVGGAPTPSLTNTEERPARVWWASRRQLSDVPALSITSNPPKTRRIKAESISQSFPHSPPFFWEITAEGEKQSRDPVLFRRNVGAPPKERRGGSSFITLVKTQKIHLWCCDTNSGQV